MKKLLVILMSFIIIVASATSVVSCDFNSLLINLNKLPDYDWTKENPYYAANNFPKLKNVVNEKIKDNSLSLQNTNSYVHYDKFLTGFKNYNSLIKQATTGVPINSAFLPNGNFLKDLGDKDRKTLFDVVNDLVDWSPNIDHDAKYNMADNKLLPTMKVASKWVNSQNSKINALNMGLLANSTSGESTIVGSQRMFGNNFNNWQYLNTYVHWAGSASEGIIVPPPADAVNAAHINGVKVYGNVFLDGYHGLTKQMLKYFALRDNSGHYLVVDSLIALATELGFDGWFWNNEPNGAFPNGLILDSQNCINIIDQFNDEVKAKKLNLEIISYKNDGNLTLLPNGQASDSWSNKLANATNGYFQQNFYTYPNDSAEWSKLHPQADKFQIYNMYNVQGWIGGKIFYNKKRYGTRDLRELAYMHLDPNGQPYTSPEKEQEDWINNKWTYAANPAASISMFRSTGANDFASDYLNEITKKRAITNKDDVAATLIQNHYDDMLYTGRNGYLSDNDYGTTSWDPNFDVTNMSYGVGDLVQENTVLFNNPKSSDPKVNGLQEFLTNFSTGQGINFAVDSNHIINGPWNNRRLSDTQPTYKWQVLDGITGKQVSSVVGNYDYYHPYRKGNAIALGKGFISDDNNQNGKIIPAEFKKNQIINWNVMGTNYSGSDTIANYDFVYKINDYNGSQPVTDNIKVTPIITYNDGTVVPLSNCQLESDNDNGWSHLKGNATSLMAVSNKINNKTIAKLGLQIEVKTDCTATIDFGQLSFNTTAASKNSLLANNSENNINNLKSEYTIKRLAKDKKTYNYSVRLNWQLSSSLENLNFYLLYLEDESKNYYFLGATKNPNYYVPNIQFSQNLSYKLIIQTVTNNNVNFSFNNNFQSWKIIL